jgi:polar amino acid transport system substrate-binding protein
MFDQEHPVYARRSVLGMLGAVCLQVALPPTAIRTYSVGSTATGVPFTFLDMKTNRLSGAMVEIMAAIAAEAGFRTQTSVMSFAALVPSLLAGKIDIICAAILRTEARAQVVDFTEPVYSYGGGLVVAGSDKGNYASIDDLRGKIAGVQMGTLYGDQARAAGARRVVYYDSLPDVLHDLHAGRIDAAYGDAPILAYQTSVINSASLRFVRSFKPPALQDVCLVVRKGNTALLRSINASIDRIKSTAIRHILDRWSLG